MAEKKLTPVKSIRAKCLDCSVYQPQEVRLCPAINCPIHSYRMGKRPKKSQDSPINSRENNVLNDSAEECPKV